MLTIPYLLEQTPRCLLNFLFCGYCGVYLRAVFIAKFIPIDLPCLLKNFLDANANNKVFEKVTGGIKREVGLVVPAKLLAFTTEIRIAEVLEGEISSRTVKYRHFELKNIVFEKNKFPRLA